MLTVLAGTAAQLRGAHREDTNVSFSYALIYKYGSLGDTRRTTLAELEILDLARGGYLGRPCHDSGKPRVKHAQNIPEAAIVYMWNELPTPAEIRAAKRALRRNGHRVLRKGTALC